MFAAYEIVRREDLGAPARDRGQQQWLGIRIR